MTLAHTTGATTNARRSSAGPGHPPPTPLPVARTACACGASAFGQPPSLCLTHALEAERCQAQRMLTLARRGITQARRLAARYPHNPTLRQEAGQWLAEAQDDLREATHRLTLLAPPPSSPSALGHCQEGR